MMRGVLVTSVIAVAKYQPPKQLKEGRPHSTHSFKRAVHHTRESVAVRVPPAVVAWVW